MDKELAYRKYGAYGGAFLQEHLRMLTDYSLIPVSFKYDGRLYRGLSELELIDKKVGNGRYGENTLYRLSFKLDEAVTVSVKIEYCIYYGAFEYTVFFKNTGTKNSGQISEVIDASLYIPCSRAEINGIGGDHESHYEPYRHYIGSRFETIDGHELHRKSCFASNSGRATHDAFPCFNLRCDGGGALIALGWAGTWSADFEYHNPGCVTVINSNRPPQEKIELFDEKSFIKNNIENISSDKLNNPSCNDNTSPDIAIDCSEDTQKKVIVEEDEDACPQEHISFLGRSTLGLNTFLRPGEEIRTALVLMIPYGNPFGNPFGDKHARAENSTQNKQNKKQPWIDTPPIGYSQNLWRSWFMDYNMPRANTAGEEIKPFTTACLAGDTGLPNSDGSISERSFTWQRSIDKILEEKIPLDFRWIDAGWYYDSEGNTVESDWWGTVGSWELDRVKWPGDSLRKSVDYCESRGIKTLMWFEPERVTKPEALEKNYGYKKEYAVTGERHIAGYSNNKNTITNNIGNPDCLEWTLSRIVKTMDENNIHMYREDNNCNPMYSWRMLDIIEEEKIAEEMSAAKDPNAMFAPDMEPQEALSSKTDLTEIHRQGISENKLISGHYKLWDSIIMHSGRRGGCTFVDNCASGGGRNDLESLRRSVPLLRSDRDRTTTALRLAMTTSFNLWVPFCGASTKETRRELEAGGVSDRYIFRASYLPALNLSVRWTQNPNIDYEDMRASVSEWQEINKFLLGDMYVLTPRHGAEDKKGWTVIMYTLETPVKAEKNYNNNYNNNYDEKYDCPELSGIILCFRMEECEQDTYNIALPEDMFDLFYVGNKEKRIPAYDINGSVLTKENNSYTIKLNEKRSSCILKIKRL